LLYRICARPSLEVVKAVLDDVEGYVASFGLPPEEATSTAAAWKADLSDFMEGSEYAFVEPTPLFSIKFDLLDPDAGPYPVRFFAQTITPSHAALLYHQPSVQLTPMVAGVITAAEAVRAAALRLSSMAAPLLPLECLGGTESDLPVDEVRRLVYASNRLQLDLVLRVSRDGMLLVR
jgi:hypothetical protein